MRHLKDEEKALIAKLIQGLSTEALGSESLDTIRVEEMADGGMGSLSFVRPFSGQRRFGKQFQEAMFSDADGVVVSVTINLDQDGFLFELDMWKTDFSPLKRIPAPSEIRIRTN